MRNPRRAHSVALVVLLLASGLTAVVAQDAQAAAPAAAKPDTAKPELPMDMDWEKMFSSMLDDDLSKGANFGDFSSFGDEGVADIFGSLKDLMSGMDASSHAFDPTVIRTMTTTSTSGTGSDAEGDAGSSAAADAASQLFASLFEGETSPYAAFMNSRGAGAGAGAGGAGSISTLLSSFLGSSGAGPQQIGDATDRSFLLPSGGSLGGLAAFAALLKPVGAQKGSQNSLVQQLSAAMQQADALFQAPNINDLFGGFEITNFIKNLKKEDRQLLSQAIRAAYEMEDRYCTPAHLAPSKHIPTNCVGHNITLSIQGGYCVINHDRTVVCKKPRVLLIKEPPRCTLHYNEPTRVVGKECKVVKDYGERHQGTIKHPKSSTHELPGLEDVDLSQLQPQPRTNVRSSSSKVAPVHHHSANSTHHRSGSTVGGFAHKLSGLQHGIVGGISAIRHRVSNLLSHWKKG